MTEIMTKALRGLSNLILLMVGMSGLWLFAAAVTREPSSVGRPLSAPGVVTVLVLLVAFVVGHARIVRRGTSRDIPSSRARQITAPFLSDVPPSKRNRRRTGER